MSFFFFVFRGMSRYSEFSVSSTLRKLLRNDDRTSAVTFFLVSLGNEQEVGVKFLLKNYQVLTPLVSNDNSSGTTMYKSSSSFANNNQSSSGT